MTDSVNLADLMAGIEYRTWSAEERLYRTPYPNLRVLHEDADLLVEEDLKTGVRMVWNKRGFERMQRRERSDEGSTK